MKLNFIKKTLLLFALSIAIVGCDEEDQTGHSQQVPSDTTLSVSLDFANPIIFKEADGDMVYNYTVSLSETQISDTRLYIQQTGGTADDHDIAMTSLIVIPAGYLTGSGEIMIYADEEIEGDETAIIEIGDVRTANAAFTPVTVNINIVDYVFCFWTLVANDSYGDGWNGASIDVTVDGTTTSYATDGSSTTHNIAVTAGSPYSFAFSSGDWDSEITYTLTSPDGTVWADGPSPTVGVITSGTNDCP
jgi:hypothetical protein